MSEDTKAKALDKLATFNPKIGAPSWRDYSTLNLIPTPYRRERARRQRARTRPRISLGRPVDWADEWYMTSQTVNASTTNPTQNEIVFPPRSSNPVLRRRG